MKIEQGVSGSDDGPGWSIQLTGDEVATAIDAFLVAHGVVVSGARTVLVNDELCVHGEVYVDPTGTCIVEALDR